MGEIRFVGTRISLSGVQEKFVNMKSPDMRFRPGESIMFPLC